MTGSDPDAYLDTHVHFWDPTRLTYRWLDDDPVLGRPFLPEHLDPAGPAPVGVVFVQAECAADQWLAEVDWVGGLTPAGFPVLGLVARAALEDGPDCAPGLDVLAARPEVVGVRRLIQDEPPGFALDPRFVTAVGLAADRGLTVDLCVRHHQLPEVTELVRRVPTARFVLDHLGKPGIAARARQPWADDLARLAALPNVGCKLSGLAPEADDATRLPQVLLPYLRHAIDVFGPQRCMFGSDWPVSSTVTGYGWWRDLVFEAVSDLGGADRARILTGTARDVYRCGQSPSPGDRMRPGAFPC